MQFFHCKLVSDTFLVIFNFPIFCQVQETNGGDEDDEEGWEDASDSEEDDDAVEEASDSEHNSRSDEKKDKEKEKPVKSKDNSPAPRVSRSRPTSAGSPKEQRTPRPKVHIPPPAAVQESPEGGKPLSPFSPLDSHQPVSDWGEEMELLSPRSSLGGESPLKPPSQEASPPQRKDQEQDEETESQAASSNEPAEPQKGKDTGGICTQVSSLNKIKRTTHLKYRMCEFLQCFNSKHFTAYLLFSICTLKIVQKFGLNLFRNMSVL